MVAAKFVALTRDAIIAADDLPLTKVPVSEWGGSVFVRPLTAGERVEFEDRYFDPEAKNTAAWLLVKTVCDANGDRLFTDDDIDVVAGKGSVPVLTVYDVVMEVNGITGKAKEDLKGN